MRLLSRQVSLPVILLGVIVLLIFLHLIGILKPIESVLVDIFRPLQERVYGFGTQVNGVYNRSKITVEEYEALKKQRDDLLVDNAQLKVQIGEFEQFTRQNTFLRDRGLTSINARVIGKNFQSDAQILSINKGADDGVDAGMAVVVDEGILVARVLSVDARRSEILLINDSQSSIAAEIQSEIPTAGKVVGERGLSIKMELITKDSIIETGSTVITSGLEDGIPRGLVIGTIARIEPEQNSLFQTGFISSLVNFEQISAVSVVTLAQ